MGFVLLAVPAIAVLLFALSKSRTVLHAVSTASSFLLLLAGGFVTKDVLLFGQASVAFFYVDALSILMLDLMLLIVLAACIYSIGYLEAEIAHGTIAEGKLKIFYILMHTFILTMVLSLTVKNIGILWIAIEATTLASAFLVGFYNDRQAIEAAWKYVMICSVGIAIAMLGIILLHLSSVHIIQASNLLDWTELYRRAPDLQHPVLRLAFIFILIGFGTKAGLAPMHTWLPDAHSQAPSPISALLSGVLLNSAMYGMMRVVAIVNRSLGSSDFTGRLLMGAGIISIAAAAVIILTQKDYKRLLAYSSVEHMGFVAFALGVFTPASVFGALFHMLNHSFTKSMLFLSSGSILQKYHTKEISKVTGILKTLPISGTVFLLGLFAIAGTPPFSIFASELNVLVTAFQAGHFIAGSVVILLLALIFAGIAVAMFKMFYGNPESSEVPAGETNLAGACVLTILLLVVLLTGLVMPPALKNLLMDAQKIITGG